MDKLKNEIDNFLNTNKVLKDYEDNIAIQNKESKELVKVNIGEILYEFCSNRDLYQSEQKSEPFYVFAKFNDEQPISVFTVTEGKLSINFLYPENEEKTDNLQFKNLDKKFTLYSRTQDNLTKEEKDLIKKGLNDKNS